MSCGWQSVNRKFIINPQIANAAQLCPKTVLYIQILIRALYALHAFICKEKKYVSGSFKSASHKKIGSANRKFAKCHMHICGRSANLTDYSSPWGGGAGGRDPVSINLIETTNESISGIDITIPYTVQGFTRSLMLTSGEYKGIQCYYLLVKKIL